MYSVESEGVRAIFILCVLPCAMYCVCCITFGLQKFLFHEINVHPPFTRPCFSTPWHFKERVDNFVLSFGPAPASRPGILRSAN